MRTKRELETFVKKYLKKAAVVSDSTGELIIHTGLGVNAQGQLEDLEEDDLNPRESGKIVPDWSKAQ